MSTLMPPPSAPVCKDEDFFSQTQKFSATTSQLQPDFDSDVYAKLEFTHGPRHVYEIRRDQKQVEIGRHPSCDIVVPDKVISSKHLRIYRDDSFHYFVELLSANGAFCNDHNMSKGDERELQHGDKVSCLVHPDKNPPSAFNFRLTGHSSDPPEAKARENKVTPMKLRQMSTTSSPPLEQQRLVSEKWVQDHWNMRTVLGSGNFSEVRLGTPVRKRDGFEKCAVKVIDKKRFTQFQTKRESQLSLQSEAEMLMSLKHPGIIQIYEWFQTEEKLYIAMEFLAGGDLLQFILENGCFSENAARRLFKEIVNGVKYLHENQVVHRDLKPENILLTCKAVDKMQPKLADFGLARKNMKTKDCKTFCGTPHYFAPEVIHTFRDRDQGQNGGYGKQADMWSLGVILYIMLSGIPPFEEEGLYEQILEGKYEFDVTEWNQVTPEAKDLVRKLMTVNPRGRLNISETLSHQWFLCAGCGDLTPPDTIAREARIGEVRYASETKEDMDSKRRRTDDFQF